MYFYLLMNFVISKQNEFIVRNETQKKIFTLQREHQATIHIPESRVNAEVE